MQGGFAPLKKGDVAMSPNQQIRKEARGQLRGHWPQALAVTSVCLAAVLLFTILREGIAVLSGVIPLASALGDQPLEIANPYAYLFISSLVTLVQLLVMAPLLLGAVKWFFRRARGEEVPVSVIFDYFSGRALGRALVFLGQALVRLAGWGALSFLPGLACAYFAEKNNGSTVSVTAGNMLGSLAAVLLALGTLLFVPMMLRYFLAPFLFTEDDALPAAESFRLSVERMSGFRGHVFVLGCTFIGWLLLCLFAFPLLYVLPYLAAAMANCAKWILFEYHRAQEARAFYQEQAGRWQPPAGQQ